MRMVRQEREETVIQRLFLGKRKAISTGELWIWGGMGEEGICQKTMDDARSRGRGRGLLI